MALSKLYNPEENQAYLRSMLRIGTRHSETYGFGKVKYEDEAGNKVKYDCITGTPLEVIPGPRAVKDGLDSDAKFRGERIDYNTLTTYILHPDGTYFNSHQQFNRLSICLDPVQRYLYNRVREYVMKAHGLQKEQVINDLTIVVNHADLDKKNDFLYNLDICLNGQNARHGHFVRKIMEYDDNNKPNYKDCNHLKGTALGGRVLRKGVYMSAMMVPEAFGDYLTCGVNGAERPDGEPYSRYMSRVLSDANLPFDIDFITVTNKKGKKSEIRVSCRTIHQILADCYKAGAEKIVDCRGDIRLWDYVFENDKPYVKFVQDKPAVSDFEADKKRHSVPEKIIYRLQDLINKGYYVRLYTDCGDVSQMSAFSTVKQGISDLLRTPGRCVLIEVSKRDTAGSYRTIYDARGGKNE